MSRAFTAALPESDDNRRLLGELAGQVKGKHDVVVVEDVTAREGGGLDLQARVLAQARAFFGGYGDLAVLAAGGTLRFRPRADGGLSVTWTSPDGKTSMEAGLRSLDLQRVLRHADAR